jgi:hypothetical protein
MPFGDLPEIRSLGKPIRLQDNIKMVLREIICGFGGGWK